MSYNRIWIHANFSTKDRQPNIQPEHEGKIHAFLAEQLRKTGCIPKCINGIEDHVHLLFLATAHMSLDDVMKQIKGASSHYINANKLCDYHFRWQTGYAGFSVSESGVDPVHFYIANQKEHHKKQTAVSEWEEMHRKNGLVY
jgi:REP element-mobilizing transposase RayT